MVKKLDQVFELLQTRPRRMALELVKQGELVPVGSLVTQLPGHDRKIRIHLEHSHLPKLAEAGYINWNKDNDVISRGPQFAEIEPVLEFFETYANDTFGDWP